MFKSLYGKQCGPRSDCSLGAVCSGSMLFAFTRNLSVMLGNYLQQTTSADDIFRCIFFLGPLKVNKHNYLTFLIPRAGSHMVFVWILCTDVLIHCTDILNECK